jgi:predicted ATP-binding protein involved in virulence
LGASAIQETGGVVLIDEIDLHLHPKWQQQVLDDLLGIFPKMQFIATTHAPSVIHAVKNESLLLLRDNDVIYPKDGAYGMDVNSVLLGIMDARVRPATIQNELAQIYKYIDDDKLEQASTAVAELERIVGYNDPEISGIKVTIDFMELEE